MSGRTRLLLAAGLTLAALGMSWSATESTVTSGYLTPSFCTTTYDGYLDCTPGSFSPGLYVPGTDTRGFESSARVLLVPALAALVLASRRRTSVAERLVRGATVALGGATVLAFGTASAAGAPVVALAATLCARSVARPAGRAWSPLPGARGSSPTAGPTPTPGPAPNPGPASSF